jgi:hypothetical protein
MLDKPMLGRSKYERPKGDFFPTPDWCTEVLLRHFTPAGMVWEPACGEGHMSRVIERKGHFVFSTTLYDQGYGHGRDVDFLAEKEPMSGIYSIITNPPYSIADEFVEHAIKLMRARGGAVAMLLRNEWDCASSRRHLFMPSACFDTKIVLTKRPRWIEGSKGSPRHSYAWYVWDFGLMRGRCRIIHDQ